MKVLVVDDSVSVRKALERILKTRKLEVIATGSAEEALEKVAGGPALVIADVVMPGMDGFELCKKLKADARYEQLPVLLISGIVNAEVTRRAEKVGATGIVKKPFTPEDLFPKIELALASVTPAMTNAEPADTEPADTGAVDTEPASPQVAPETVAVPSAPVPQGSVGEVLEALLQPLLTNSAVDAALVADARGNCLAQLGRGLDDAETLGVYSRTLASVAAALGDNLGVGAFGGLHLDYQGHSLLITRLATRGTLLLRVKDASSIGVARYLVRKFVEEEARASKAQVSKAQPALVS